MQFNQISKIVVILGLSTALSGCLGSSSGGGALNTGTTAGATTSTTGSTGTTGGSTGGPAGGTTGGGTALTPAEFDAKALEYAVVLQSTTTPMSGNAEYVGRVSVLTGANDANSAEAVYGDANLNVDFGSTAVNPVSGTVGNFAGPVNGVDTTIVGVLSTENALSNDVNSVTTGTGGLTSITATLRGDLSDPSGELTGNARMILNGNLKGDNGAQMSGGHQTTIFVPDQDSIATGGSFFADKQ